MSKITQREHEALVLAVAHLNRVLEHPDNGVMLDLTTAGTMVQMVLDAVDNRELFEAVATSSGPTAGSEEDERYVFRQRVIHRVIQAADRTSQSAVAEEVGVANSTVNRIVNAGEGSDALIEKFAAHYGIEKD